VRRPSVCNAGALWLSGIIFAVCNVALPYAKPCTARHCLTVMTIRHLHLRLFVGLSGTLRNCIFKTAKHIREILFFHCPTWRTDRRQPLHILHCSFKTRDATHKRGLFCREVSVFPFVRLPISAIVPKRLNHSSNSFTI